MDFEHAPDLDLDLDLEDAGLPPLEELHPGPERAPGRGTPATDPAVPMLTPVMLGVITAFGALYCAIMMSGGAGGEALAWALGGTFAALYVGVFWMGARFIERYRY